MYEYIDISLLPSPFLVPLKNFARILLWKTDEFPQTLPAVAPHMHPTNNGEIQQIECRSTGKTQFGPCQKRNQVASYLISYMLSAGFI